MPTAVLLAVFVLGAGALWGLNWTRGRAACDQYDWHLKAILKFAGELPRPDLRDYLSATTPGYHLVMGAVARCVSAQPLVLQIVASVFTLGLLVVFERALSREGARRGHEPIALVALALPVVCSPYVFTAGVWLLPDNAGWLLVLGVLLVALWRGLTARALVACSCLLVLTVLVRQNHLWVAAPLVVAAWLAPTPALDDSFAGALRRPGPRLAKTLAALAVCMPAVLVVAAFAVCWHGLVPPTFQKQHAAQGMLGVNWSTPAFILALFGVFSPFYVGWMWPGLVKLWKESRGLLIGIALLAMVAAALPPTNYQYEPRASGLWQVVKWLDEHGLVIRWHGMAHTSPLIVVLATLGAVMLAGWLALIQDKRRWIFAAAIGAFVAAQAANANCWQRYHEPLLLMLMGLVSAGYARELPEPTPRRHPSLIPILRIAGPLALALLLGCVTVAGLMLGRDPLANPEQTAAAMSHDPAR